MPGRRAPRDDEETAEQDPWNHLEAPRQRDVVHDAHHSTDPACVRENRVVVAAAGHAGRAAEVSGCSGPCT